MSELRVDRVWSRTPLFFMCRSDMVPIYNFHFPPFSLPAHPTSWSRCTAIGVGEVLVVIASTGEVERCAESKGIELQR
jgi:hypothetical protein